MDIKTFATDWARNLLSSFLSGKHLTDEERKKAPARTEISGAWKGGAALKIVARIQKVAFNKYVLEGKVYSFLSARREMSQLSKQRRIERRLRASDGSQSGPRGEALMVSADGDETTYSLLLRSA